MQSLTQKIKPGSVILSPMAGYSDKPYRLLCREQGSAASITEFVSAEALRRDIKRSYQMLQFDETERPVIFQIFGENPDSILEAARIIARLQPDGIDLNMGCSVKKIASKGSGAALLKEPAKVKEIMRLLAQNLHLPVSAKIRLGWSEQEKNYLEIGDILQGEGAWAVFVHGRTKAQAYHGFADWEAIGKLASRLSIPVYGNGDIQTLEEARQKIKQYQLAGALIGRAAMGNPWIFSGRDIKEIGFQERVPLILRHLQLMCDFYGESHGTILFRKHLGKYLKYLPNTHTLKDSLFRETSRQGVELLLKDHW